MANRLNMAIVETIQRLHASGWSQRRIARELAIDRETVRRYLSCGEKSPKPAILPAGSFVSKPATFSGSPGPGSGDTGRVDGADSASSSNPAIVPPGSDRPSTALEPCRLDSEPAIVPTGSDEAVATDNRFESTAEHFITTAPAKTAPMESSPAGRSSQCTPYQSIIVEKLRQQLSAQRIYQDLMASRELMTASSDSCADLAPRKHYRCAV
jgi:hypothetical protein